MPFKIKKKQTYKPDSVYPQSQSFAGILIIYLMLPTLRDCASSTQTSVYMVLQPARFTLPLLSPTARCALTAPFHLFPDFARLRRGSLFSVALSVCRSSLPFQGARRSVLSGLSSPTLARLGRGDKAVCFRGKGITVLA